MSNFIFTRKEIKMKKGILFLLLIIVLFFIACSDDENEGVKDVLPNDTISTQDVVEEKDSGPKDEGIKDADIKDVDIEDIISDIADTEWSPTPEEYNEAVSSIEEDNLAQLMVNLSAAIGEASAQFAEIENINPAPLPPPELPECPIIKKDLGLDPKIILNYVTVSKDENGNDVEVEGCTGQNGVFATGSIEITRVGKLKDKYTRITFKNHVRGKRVRAPELNGCVKVTKVSANVYDIESDSDANCELKIKLGKDINGNDVVYNSTICAALRVEIKPLENRLRFTNIDIRFNRQSVSCDKSSRSVTISELDGKSSELVYPYPIAGQTTCPISGSIRISGKYFKTEDEFLGLSYGEVNGFGKLAKIGIILANGIVKDNLSPEYIGRGVVDLKGIEAMCLPDTQRLYSCIIPDENGECKDIAGTYIAFSGDSQIKYLDKDANIIANGPIGLDVPQDMCFAASAGEDMLIKDLSMFMKISPNCATSFVIGNPSYSTRAMAGCGKVEFLNQEKTKFDVVNEDGGFSLSKLLGTDNFVVCSGWCPNDVGVVLTCELKQESYGAMFCYSDNYFGSSSNNLAVNSAARERCLDKALAPASIWSSENPKALWDTLALWGNNTELTRACSTYTDKLAKDISNYDDIVDDVTGEVTTYGTDIEWKDNNGNILPISEPYGKNLISVMADPIAHDGSEDFYNPLPPAAYIMDATTKEVMIPLKKSQTGCTDSKKCYSEPKNESEVDWDIQSNKFFSNTSITKGLKGKRFMFIVGRIKINFPQYEDFKKACEAYVSGCDKLLNIEKVCDTVVDPNCLDETQKFCTSLEEFCSIFNLENPAQNLSGNIDDLPASWTTPITISNGTSGDPLNLDQVDIKSIGMVLRGIAKQKASLLSNDIYRDFAMAYVEMSAKQNGTDYVSVEWKDNNNQTKSAKLQPMSIFSDQVIAPITPIVNGNTIQDRLFAISSKVPNSIQYLEDTNYKFKLGQDFTEVIPKNLSSDSITSIVAPREIKMCLPPPIILDNIYFPTIRWSPLIPEADLLSSILNENKDAIDWSKFDTTSGKELMSKLSEAAQKFVTIYVGAYNRKEYIGSWPQARPLPQIYYHNELRKSIRPFPDVGFYVTTPMHWWDIAPAGRDYMQGMAQEVIDYLLDIAIIRANHKILKARDIYGSNYSVDKENDVAIVISLDMELQPTIVINSDKLPGGNVTHFWRRDLVGLMVPSYNACK